MSKNNKNFFKIKNTWSEIKDQLLGCYLTPYFQKILTTGCPVFYVDCFAGKGKYEDEKPGSPLIALQVRDNCMKTAKSHNRKIDTCFIDLNYAQELRTNTANFNSCYGNVSVISGKYEEEIESLLSDKHGANVFLYIDPYGIKALDSALFDKFDTYGFASLEMLINFNSFGFFRDACRVMKVDYEDDEALRDLDDLVEYEPTEVSSSKQSESLLSNIAGGDYWKDIVTNYNHKKINGYQAEKRLSAEYKKRLRQRYKYVLDMPIRLKAGQRPKYRMIHVCNHEDGCFLMAQNMQKRKDELFINIQQSGQLSMMDSQSIISSTAENEIMTNNEIKAKLKEHLLKFPRGVRITKFLANFVNDYGLLCEFKMIYSLLDEMSNDKMMDIERIPAVTGLKKPSLFWEERNSRKVIIRRHIS